MLEIFGRLNDDRRVDDVAFEMRPCRSQPIVRQRSGSDDEMVLKPVTSEPDDFDLLAEVDQRINASTTTRLTNSRVSDSVHYHLAAGGSRTRARIAYRFGRSLGLSTSEAIPLAVASEAIHNASLILDDLQDRDEERRGKPAVWVAFGPDVASLASHLMVSAGFGALADPACRAYTRELVEVFHSRIASTIYGQESDLYPRVPNDETSSNAASEQWSCYVQGAIAKSGGLLSLPIEMPLIAADQSFALNIARKMMSHFATAYQVIDDLADVSRDASREERSAAPNAVRSLRQQQDSPMDGSGYSLAAKRGQSELNLAIELAEKVPGDCQRIISEEGQRLLAVAGEAIADA